jgi:hypothetical protein
MVQAISSEANSGSRPALPARRKSAPNQVLVAHQLAHGSRHFRRDSARYFLQHLTGRSVREQPVAEKRRPSSTRWRRTGWIVAVDDQAGDLVVLVRDHGFTEKLPERQVGQRHPRRDHLLGAVGRDTGEAVAGPRRSPWRAGRANHRRRGKWHPWFGDRPWRLRTLLMGGCHRITRRLHVGRKRSRGALIALWYARMRAMVAAKQPSSNPRARAKSNNYLI